MEPNIESLTAKVTPDTLPQEILDALTYAEDAESYRQDGRLKDQQDFIDKARSLAADFINADRKNIKDSYDRTEKSYNQKFQLLVDDNDKTVAMANELAAENKQLMEEKSSWRIHWERAIMRCTELEDELTNSQVSNQQLKADNALKTHLISDLEGYVKVQTDEINLLQIKVKEAEAELTQIKAKEKRFKVMGWGTISWNLAERAYAKYAQKYGTSQSIDTINDRGGFGEKEMDLFVPGWRETESKIQQLEAELLELKTWLDGSLIYAHVNQLKAENKQLRSLYTINIQAAVEKFLAWHLPQDFAPDGGIKYERGQHFATGTNLLTATQAKEMFEYCLTNSPINSSSTTHLELLEYDNIKMQDALELVKSIILEHRHSNLGPPTSEDALLSVERVIEETLHSVTTNAAAEQRGTIAIQSVDVIAERKQQILKDEYKWIHDEIGRLLALDADNQLSEQDDTRLEVLSILMEAYEKELFPFPSPDPTTNAAQEGGNDGR